MGDTLSALAGLESIDDVMAANCLDDPRFIRVGQQLYLPFAPAAPTDLPDAAPSNPNPAPDTGGGDPGGSGTSPGDGRSRDDDDDNDDDGDDNDDNDDDDD